MQTALTTPRPQPVTIDLSGVKDTLNKLIDVTGREQAAEKLNQVPDQVTLLDTNKLPNVYAAGQALLFMGPITLIVGVVLLAYPHIRRRNYAQSSTILLLQGSLLLLTGLLAYAIGPIFRPTVLAQVSSANLRVVVENIYNTFISSFNAQSAWLLYVGGLLVLIPCGVWLYHTSVVQELKGKLKRG